MRSYPTSSDAYYICQQLFNLLTPRGAKVTEVHTDGQERQINKFNDLMLNPFNSSIKEVSFVGEAYNIGVSFTSPNVIVDTEDSEILVMVRAILE